MNLNNHMDNIPFPLKLYNLLELLSSNEAEIPIIGWLKHGKSFCIFNPKRFEEEIIPEYFKHTRMSSFQRQLNLYGFRRISLTEEVRGSYYHRSFQRGRLDLLADVRRDTVKGGKTKFDQFDCDSSNSSSAYDDSGSSCKSEVKKPKISQYREYLNSCSIPFSHPPVQPEELRVGNLHSHNHFNHSIHSHPPKFSMPSNVYNQSFGYSMQPSISKQGFDFTIPSNNYRQSAESVKAIQEVFMNQVNDSNDDYYRAAQSISTTVPSLMYGFENNNNSNFFKEAQNPPPSLPFNNRTGPAFMNSPPLFMNAPIDSINRSHQNCSIPSFGNKRPREQGPLLKLSPSLMKLINPVVDGQKNTEFCHKKYLSYPSMDKLCDHQESDISSNDESNKSIVPSWGYFEDSSCSSPKHKKTSSNSLLKLVADGISETDDFQPFLDVDDMRLLDDFIESEYSLNNW